MAYRNGTYVAFHAQGTNIPTDSDIKYYNLLKAWTEKKDDEFSFVNSHEKTYAVRDTSRKTTLQNRLKERLCNSKNMLLIVGPTTKFDKDWVPFEISYAVDQCRLPIIVTYPNPNLNWILYPNLLRDFWPKALAERIDSGKLKAIHIPFRKPAIKDAIEQFHLKNPPNTSLDFYSKETYNFWGIPIHH